MPKYVGKTYSSLFGISNDNGVGVISFVTSNNLTVKSTMFPHRNIHIFTWTPRDGKKHSQIVIEEGIQLYLMSDR
jgi:hypothetical protein